MNIPITGSDKVVSTQLHEGNILVFTEYGEIFIMNYVGSNMEWVIRKL